MEFIIGSITLELSRLRRAGRGYAYIVQRLCMARLDGSGEEAVRPKFAEHALRHTSAAIAYTSHVMA